MEFWGVEVKPGKPVTVKAEDDTLVHISQASLGDCKGKKGESVSLYVKVGTQKLVLGTLQTENIPQLSCDLVFEKEFEISHNGKGSVYFVGYKSPNIDGEGDDFSDSEGEEEEIEEVPATVTANGYGKAAEVKDAKPADDDEEDDSDSEGMDEDGSDDDEDDSEEEEETPTPKKPESKKRTNEAAPKSPVSAKKAKGEEKKKGGPATPHPAKKGGKTPTAATQSPKSAISCGSCKKTFNSGNALESHNKAKHSAAK